MYTIGRFHNNYYGSDKFQNKSNRLRILEHDSVDIQSITVNYHNSLKSKNFCYKLFIKIKKAI